MKDESSNYSYFTLPPSSLGFSAAASTRTLDNIKLNPEISVLTRRLWHMKQMALPQKSGAQHGTEPVAVATGFFSSEYPLATASGSVPAACEKTFRAKQIRATFHESVSNQ